MCLLRRVTCMEQDDISGMGLTYYAINKSVDTFIQPILRVCIPLYDGIAEIISNAQHTLVEVAVRQANEVRLLTN
ncbi:hypothetical protein D3C86_2127500 [compost metagenome]